MPGAPIQTWKDLLLPNEQDTSVILRRVTEGENIAQTSSFSLPAWDPERLPPSSHLFEVLPSKMQEHLGIIIDNHFSDRAERTSFTNSAGFSFTPDNVLNDLRIRCTSFTFNLSYESVSRTISELLSFQVHVIYEALTGIFLDIRNQEHTSNSSVVTDRTLRLDDGIKILWGEKSSRAFDRFIGELMERMRDGSPVELCNEPVPTTYHGYKAILGKVRVCPFQPSSI